MGMSNLTIIKLTIFTIVIFISGVDGLFQIEKLNNTVEISRSSPVGTVVKKFTVKTTPQVPVAAGFPMIMNSNPYSQAFIVTALLPNDYQVVLVENLPQDFPPITQQYELQIYAEDIRGDTGMKTLVVNVTEQSRPLKFRDNLGNQDVLIYIEERTNPGLIYQPSVFHLGKNNLTYSLAPSTPEFFNCDSTNGFIYSLKPFRFDKDPHSYILMLNVNDGTYIISGRIIVYIVNMDDGTITFTQFFCTYPGSEGKMNISTTKTCTIPEELLPGTEVARISAQDPDDFNFLTILHYSMTGSTNFSINPLTGAIQVTKRIDRDTPPYKNKPLVPLHVTVRNTLSGKSAETEITFNIMDLNDMPPNCTPQVYWLVWQNFYTVYA
ncbi:cadherin-related family member 3-like isoform X2 [Erpetoichthys calabaricus]|uniref:cadherin-related family member 3-like isoform X2 n=1 Tax=Erpetoichthys calabaricus TaxID=27687 RepID=UPI0022341C15|nr:cadherin-related family member 3-like isoform X2 [Erpetoichthys calabaricus]